MDYGALRGSVAWRLTDWGYTYTSLLVNAMFLFLSSRDIESELLLNAGTRLVVRYIGCGPLLTYRLLTYCFSTGEAKVGSPVAA